MKKTIQIGLSGLVLLIQACGLSENKEQDQKMTTIDSISDSTALGKNPAENALVNKQELVFINAAAVGGMMELEAANTAITLSENQQVKDFAMQMLTDHTKANKELKDIANKLGLSVPSSLPKEQEKHVAMLKSLADKKFNQQYMTMMLSDHAKTEKLFAEGATLPTASVRSFAAKTLPVIKGHYLKAKEIAKALNISNVGNGDDPQGKSPSHVNTK